MICRHTSTTPALTDIWRSWKALMAILVVGALTRLTVPERFDVFSEPQRKALEKNMLWEITFVYLEMARAERERWTDWVGGRFRGLAIRCDFYGICARKTVARYLPFDWCFCDSSASEPRFNCLRRHTIPRYFFLLVVNPALVEVLNT